MVLGMPTISKRRKALQKLPSGLYDSFQSIIVRIRECPREGQAELGMQVLMWLHFAYRPLKVAELQHALAVEKSDSEFDTSNIPPQKVLIDCCLGLVLVDEETLTVRFVHYTLEEYFRKHFRAEFPDGYSSVAETCLTYLNFGKLKQHCKNLNTLREKMEQYAFLNYAALYWGIHFRQQCNDSLTKLAKTIVEHESERPPCAIQALYLGLDKSRPSRRLPIARKFSGIHIIAYFGLCEYMAYLCKVERHNNLEQMDDSDRTPLSWAAEYGHEYIVQMLVERDDVYINSKDSKLGRTPLSWAADRGHGAVVRLLMKRGDIDINTKDKSGRTPLVFAARKGHHAVVQLLIERDEVDINPMAFCGQTPLILAAERGHEPVVQLLVGVVICMYSVDPLILFCLSKASHTNPIR